MINVPICGICPYAGETGTNGAEGFTTQGVRRMHSVHKAQNKKEKYLF